MQKAIRQFGLALLLVLCSIHGHTAEIKGVYFPDMYTEDGVELHLKGVAVLKWAMLINVYAGGFYLPEQVSGSAWSGDLPKRLELAYFREITAQEFTDSSISLLRDNLSEDAYQTIEPRLLAFCNLFQNVGPGDRYSLTYHPDRGTELRLNNQLLGGVQGLDFAVAYFGIWLGPTPISETFRDKLLKD
ncbi:MAG: chalcone isomerase family protein [Deltaproteobacteria bacterium]|jgi:hypothetical protein|nr:chalcone isomerase family protein [Deltaproteobacteria bacterium]